MMGQTIISIAEVNSSIVIEAKNNIEIVRLAEPNNNLVLKIIKAAFYLKLKTIRTLITKWLND